MVSCLILKSLSRFEFIFVYGVRECSNNFTDLHLAASAPHHPDDLLNYYERSNGNESKKFNLFVLKTCPNDEHCFVMPAYL